MTDRSAFWHTFVMVRFGGLGLRCGLTVWGITIGICALGLAAGWGEGVLRAQDALTPQDQPIHTLHVYTNLMQIPVLVLSAYRTPMATIAASKFSVSIDSGPRFRPTHVRLEGDDRFRFQFFWMRENLTRNCFRRLMIRLQISHQFPCNLTIASRFSRWTVRWLRA